MANKVTSTAKQVTDQVKSSKWIGSEALHPKVFGASVGIDLGMRMLGGEKLNLKTISKSVGTSAFYALAPPIITGVLIAKDIAVGIGSLAYSGHKAFNNKLKERYQNGPRFSYQDTQQAATMRQAAVQAIQGSKLNARNELGNEAYMMHRAWSRNV